MAIELISEIVQKNNQEFPLVDSNNLRGGYYVVNDINERDKIPEIRRKLGMLCYVLSENKYYKLGETEWELAKFVTDSIPIYNKLMLDSADELPESYLTIPDIYKDLEGNNVSREIQQDGTYVDILFSAIRKLLSEVARLRNSFRYGIYSYNGTDTAMSTLSLYTDPDEEPLWAIDPEDLSELEFVDLLNPKGFNPISNINTSNLGKIVINEKVLYSSNFVKLGDNLKTIIYIETNSNQFKLTNYINFKDLNIPLTDRYLYMIILNKNKNPYIWISILDKFTGRTLIDGYLNGNTLLNKTHNILDVRFESLEFEPMEIYRLDFYSKDEALSSSDLIPTAPSEDDYKYSVAHITIRSVKNKNVLDSIKAQLPNNELIWVEDIRSLYIKNNDRIMIIGNNNYTPTPEDETMTKEELVAALSDLGYVYNTDDKTLNLKDIADITFINEDTKKTFKFYVDGEGNLKQQEVVDEIETLPYKLNSKYSSDIKEEWDIRGAIGRIRGTEGKIPNVTDDYKLYSDRLKIGAFYAPLKTDKTFGCTHAFVELENTADVDFPLQGCYLHYAGYDTNGARQTYHLELTGTIKSGSTYLIRLHKYVDDAYIKVDTFDQEWYVDGLLLDISIDPDLTYGFCLTIGNTISDLEISWDTVLVKPYNSPSGLEVYKRYGLDTGDSKVTSTYPLIYHKLFIDGINFPDLIKDKTGASCWVQTSAVAIKSNTMYRNTFELDPAKQAFQALSGKDSSRIRWAKKATDYLVIQLSEREISFPHSTDVYPIDRYTPLSSKMHKNVCTDKSKLSKTKPNMVTCSFGNNVYTTRCFNWISLGNNNEYIWVRKEGDSNWKRFESYKTVTEKASSASTYPRRKEFSVDVNNIIYARIKGEFPGDKSRYTSHKVVLELLEDMSETSPIKYEYIVGESDKNGNPNNNYCSDILYFTIYPKDYTPVIYLTSDLQGFTWIEYQVWAAAADVLNKKIAQDQVNSPKIMPILVNTGDMTLNGTRINEWYDYYQGGRNLFNHLELMNVVGNNDLCNTDPEILGTGDDVGKSNSFYFHVFYCYDTDESIYTPIINNKYIPSLYHFSTKDHLFIMVNSEITKVNCEQWFEALSPNKKPVNIYTGWEINVDANVYVDSFTSIYTMLYRLLKNNQTNENKKIIVACHEMPFTVITRDNLENIDALLKTSRSISGSLVGSHLNHIHSSDVIHSPYWFSRLLEYFNVKLCIGGHKHTFILSYPVREFYSWEEGGVTKNSLTDKYEMLETLANEVKNKVKFVWNETVNGKTKSIDHSKFPITKTAGPNNLEDLLKEWPAGYFYPYIPYEDLLGGVTYFMCLATGYKLTSNKELPSIYAKFSEVVPLTTNNDKSAALELQQPMFAKIECGDTAKLSLGRIDNIKKASDGKVSFTLTQYATALPLIKYCSDLTSTTDKFVATTETLLKEITL